MNIIEKQGIAVGGGVLTAIFTWPLWKDTDEFFSVVPEWAFGWDDITAIVGYLAVFLSLSLRHRSN